MWSSEGGLCHPWPGDMLQFVRSVAGDADVTTIQTRFICTELQLQTELLTLTWVVLDLQSRYICIAAYSEVLKLSKTSQY